MNRQKIILIILLLFVGMNSFAQNYTKEHPTFNEEMAIGIGEDSIAVYALIASGNQAKETIILLHGIPGNERNIDLAQDIRAEGKNVIFFSYRGSWGSQGKYLYSNCMEDVGHVLDHFSDSSIASKLHIDTNKFVVIGHSLGGGLSLITGAKDQRIKKIIALSATNFSYGLKDDFTVDSLQAFQNYISSSFMLNCNPKEFVQELLDNKTENNVLTYSKELEAKDVLIIDDFDRSDSWPGELKTLVEYHIIESDHSFTNKRKELSKYILAWLEKN